MATRSLATAWFGLIALALRPDLAGSQAIASPRGSVAQVVDSTTILAEYYRPSVRGRPIVGAVRRRTSLPPRDLPITVISLA